MADAREETRRAWLVAGPHARPRLGTAPAVGGPGTSRVAIEAFAISSLDRTVLDGALGEPSAYPFVPGTEGVGLVVASDVHPLGARVRIRGAGVGVGRDGTWTEEAVVPDAAVIPVPVAVPAAVACTFFSPVATAIGVVEDVAVVGRGERVLVTGATGAVGSLVARMASDRGATVIGVASGPASRGRLGPAVTEPVVPAEVPDVAPVDVVVDTVGGPLLAAAIGRVRDGGRVVLVGYAGSPEVDLDIRRLIVADVTLLPFNLVVRSEGLRERADQALPAVVAGYLPLGVDTFGFDEVPAALAAAERGPGGRRIAVLVTGPGPAATATEEEASRC